MGTRKAAVRRPVRTAAAARRRRRVRRQKILLGAVVLAVILVLSGVWGLVHRGASRLKEKYEEKYTLSDSCEAYRGTVREVAEDYGMSEYEDLILAVMMQESSGKLTDVMQASEGQFNTRYPQEPNGITDTMYSLECGIQELKYNLEKAGCTGPEDLDKIAVALQAYNFGSGYLDFLQEEGQTKWTHESAQSFAKKASGSKERSEEDPYRENAGIWDYGDQYYPKHVLRYYPAAGEAWKDL